MPVVYLPYEEPTSEQSLDDEVKEYLSDPGFRIRLDDLVARELRTVTQTFQKPEFSMTADATFEAFSARLHQYESAMARLNTVTMLVAKWGTAEHQAILERIIARLADGNEIAGGKGVWLGLRWYSILLLMYGGGIAAMSAQNYLSLSTLFNTRLGDHVSGRSTQEAIVATISGILEVDRSGAFKTLPGYERNYVPRSEYLFKTIQPAIEDVLFLGRSYEELFDRFEILYALTYADIQDRKGNHFWGPPGRFGWKTSRGQQGSPYSALLEEAGNFGDAWPPVRSGLFGGSVERFKEVARRYDTDLLSKLGWF